MDLQGWLVVAIANVLSHLPEWVVAVVALGGYIEARRARKRATASIAASVENGQKLDSVLQKTNGLMEKIEVAATAKGVLEGRADAHAEIAQGLAAVKDIIRADIKPSTAAPAEDSTLPAAPRG